MPEVQIRRSGCLAQGIPSVLSQTYDYGSHRYCSQRHSSNRIFNALDSAVGLGPAWRRLKCDLDYSGHRWTLVIPFMVTISNSGRYP